MTTLIDAWIAHSAPFTTPPTIAAAAMYYFGLNYEDKAPPIDSQLTREIHKREIYGQYYPTLEAGNKPGDQISTKFIPVNGLFLHWFFGKVAEAVAGVYTISNMDGSARKPRIGAYNTAGTKKFLDSGLVFGNLNLEWSNNRLGVSMTGKSIGHGSTTDTPSGYSYPDSIASPFTHISVMTWDGDSLKPMRFSLQAAQNLQPFIGSAGLNQEISEFAVITAAYNIQFTSASGESLLADYEAGDSKTFIWKILKSDDPTKYIQFTQTCMIKSLIPTRVHGEETVWSAVFEVGAVSIEVVDGLTRTFYGTSAP